MTVIMKCKDISKAYDNKVLFNKSSFYIKQGEKVGVYGSNGCGKTTLIKAILAQEEFEGEINISSSRKIGYISQDVIFLIQRSYRYQWSKLKEVSNKIEVKFKSFTSILCVPSMGNNLTVKVRCGLGSGNH